MSDELRRAVKQEWFDHAADFLLRARDPEALKVMYFLRNQTLLVKPVGEAMIAMDSSSSHQWVGFLPLIPGDESQHPSWKKQMETGASASFSPGNRTMVIQNQNPFSPAWKAILLLHEGHHAYTWIKNPYDHNDRRIYCEKERDTHAYQNRLVSMYGGRPYLDLIDAQVSYLEQRARDQGKNPGDGGSDDLKGVEQLDLIFGPPLSEREFQVRLAHYIVHANFELYERHRKNDYGNRQAAFLHWMYDTHVSTT